MAHQSVIDANTVACEVKRSRCAFLESVPSVQQSYHLNVCTSTLYGTIANPFSALLIMIVSS